MTRRGGHDGNPQRLGEHRVDAQLALAMGRARGTASRMLDIIRIGATRVGITPLPESRTVHLARL
jgi:hypothetical protein